MPEIEARDGDATSAAAEALRRELYWAPPPASASLAPRFHGVPLSPLAARWFSLAGALRWEYDEMFPPEPILKVGSGMRLRMKRLVWRYTRPVSRRYDRIAGDLAELGFETAQSLGEDRAGMEQLAANAGTIRAGVHGRSETAAERIDRLERQVEALQAELSRSRGDDRGTAGEDVADGPTDPEP